MFCAIPFLYILKGANYSGPPLIVRVKLDGVEVANGTANISRPKAGAHGFEVAVDSASYKSGSHKFDVACEQGSTWFQLKHSPLCTKDGVKSAC